MVTVKIPIDVASAIRSLANEIEKSYPDDTDEEENIAYIKVFLHDTGLFTFAPGRSISVDLLYSAWADWLKQNGYFSSVSKVNFVQHIIHSKRSSGTIASDGVARLLDISFRTS